MEFIKAILLGIIEGITEWLPISSTGHMILFNELTKTTTGFLTTDVFLYVIQLGAILAVVTLYFKKLNPFSPSKTVTEKKATWDMWFKVIVACIPAAVIGLLLDDYMDKIESWYVVAPMLIIYGIAFIVIENMRKTEKVTELSEMTYKTALIIGAFQVLSIIPGTSRSGSTILGAMIVGTSRSLAAEFSFFMAIPVMVGASGIKALGFFSYVSESGISVPAMAWVTLLVGCAVSFAVSMAAIRFLMDFVKKHSFAPFGIYRIALGILVLILGLIRG